MSSINTHSNLRSWWNRLDINWRKIFILNLRLELEMGVVKNYINNYGWNTAKLKSLFDDGTFCSWYKIQ
jgi:hypothetical protein